MNIKSIYTEQKKLNTLQRNKGRCFGSSHWHPTPNKKGSKHQYDRLEKIINLINTPIVIHGSTGVKDEDLIKLRGYNVGKLI